MSLSISQLSVPGQHSEPSYSIEVFDLGDLYCLESHLQPGSLDMGVPGESFEPKNTGLVFSDAFCAKKPSGLFVVSNSSVVLSDVSKLAR
jgi:hypothetical protein